MSSKPFEISDDAKCIAAAWFPNTAGNEVRFNMVHNKPSKRAYDALDELVLVGLLKQSFGPEKRITYLSDGRLSVCRQWVLGNASKIDHDFELLEPI